MYKKILIPLDGSEPAEKVLPYSRALAERLGIPVELLAVVDFTELARSVSTADGLFLDRLAKDEARRSGVYLAGISESFPGIATRWLVKQGRAADIIVEMAAAEKDTLIMMATHGRSGLNRFFLGSVTEKVLRATSSPLLVVCAKEGVVAGGEAVFKSLVVPLDGSELAESVMPSVVALAKQLDLEVILLRAYAVPYGAYTAGEGFYDPVYLQGFLARLREETIDYLENKTAALKRQGIDKVSYVAKEGLSADEIISFGRESPDSLIAMCTHGYSGVKRWVLGSVTEAVVRHAGDPVLVLRAQS
jgi:nucleotide-binding universal stress UspA family protein